MSGLAAVAALFVLYAVFASPLERWSVSAPLVFVAAGAILGPDVADLLHLDGHAILGLTEITLAILLFADASTVPLREVEGDASLPGRLLVVGLPLTIALGALAAHLLFPDAGWAAAALIGAILAPTDVALGLPVVTNTAIPVRIRRALNVESGLNDGVATPFVTLFLAFLLSEEGLGDSSWFLEATREIGLALVAAVVVGLLGGLLVAAAHGRQWTTRVSEELAVLALAFLSYTLAIAIEGNGFVAAFVAGILFGAVTRGRTHEAVEFTEAVGLLSSWFVWTVFGLLFVGPVLATGVNWTAVAYAVLSLTVIRMVPVAVALAGFRLRRDTVAFMGWFGPRGLASVVFTLVAIEEIARDAAEAGPILEVATWTILLSVVAHGLSAGPLARRYGNAVSRAEGIPELTSVAEPRVRRRSLGQTLRHPIHHVGQNEPPAPAD